MNSAKSYRVDDETAEDIKRLWLEGIQIENGLKESEIVNYILSKHLKNADINEIINGRKKRWERVKN
jgi:hypothetical protein